jgi:glycosyltransferase involved in cell wall biosynthesis
MPTLERRGGRATRTMTEIAHFIAYTGTAMGGPVQSMAAYARCLANEGCSVTVYTSLQKTDGNSIQLDARVNVVQGTACDFGPLRYSGSLRRQVQAARIDLVHSHGLWTDTHRLAGSITRVRGTPHLLAPCGMLAPGALRHHRWRKQAALLWFQDRALRDAQCLHAKSAVEHEDIRRFGLRNPVAIIANPIAAPPAENLNAETEFRDAYHLGVNSKILFYLGRLHPIKGLPRLVRAWASVAPCHKDWTLVLAGPDEAGHRKEIESLASQLFCRDRIVFTGELDEAKKWAALRAAELFVMPSDFENFGNSIVEAMSCGLGVITTTATPWKDLPAAGAGWCVEPDAEALRGAIEEALSLSDEERRHRGLRGAGLAAKFRPEETGASLLAVYEWLLGNGAKPGCVVED